MMNFRKNPTRSDQTLVIDDEATQSVIDDMYANRKHCTWTSIELHDKYVDLNGQLTRKQMLTKLIKYLGNDLVVLNIEGCVSVVGFHEYVSKILKISKVESVDEEKEDALVRKNTTEALEIPTNNKNYDLW